METLTTQIKLFLERISRIGRSNLQNNFRSEELQINLEKLTKNGYVVFDHLVGTK